MYTSNDVKILREETRRPLKSVVFALTAFEGDRELAKKYLMENVPEVTCRCGFKHGEGHNV